MIRVTGPRVLVRPREDPGEQHAEGSPDVISLGQSDSGLELAAFATDRRHPVIMGKVLALGQPARCPHCQKGRPFEIAVGDVVLFAPTAGEFVYVEHRDGTTERLLIVAAADVLAVLEKEQAA